MICDMWYTVYNLQYIYIWTYIRKTYTDVKCNEYCLSNEIKDGHIYIPSQSILISSIINRPLFDILRCLLKLNSLVVRL